MLPLDNNAIPPSDPLWYGEQDVHGVDLSLIRENLKLSPRERLRRGDRARRGTLQLLEYGRRQRATAARPKRSGEDRRDSIAPPS
jgi:hypothetical protein